MLTGAKLVEAARAAVACYATAGEDGDPVIDVLAYGCRRWLVTARPDDDEAATREWAAAILKLPRGLTASHEEYGPGGWCVWCRVPVSKWDDESFSPIRLPFRTGTTRGQVRAVFRGLGVATKEGE